VVVRKVIPGEPPSLVNPPAGCRFHPRCPAFMPGVCDVREPQMYEVNGGVRSACFLYGGAQT
jgi:peptide/nickel transport system ATP-binding protein